MKAWIWFFVGAIWFSAIALSIASGSGIAFSGIGVQTSRWITPKLALSLASLIMNFILWGWSIPIAIGIARLIKERLPRAKQ